MSRGQHVLAALSAALLTAHAIAGFYLPRMPAWRMFAYADRYTVEAWDRAGTPVDLRAYVPARAYVNHPHAAYEIAQWWARRHPERTPLVGIIMLYPDDGGPGRRTGFRLPETPR